MKNDNPNTTFKNPNKSTCSDKLSNACSEELTELEDINKNMVDKYKKLNASYLAKVKTYNNRQLESNSPNKINTEEMTQAEKERIAKIPVLIWEDATRGWVPNPEHPTHQKLIQKLMVDPQNRDESDSDESLGDLLEKYYKPNSFNDDF